LPFPHGDPCGIFGSMACRAGSRSVCGRGSLEPAGTSQLGARARRIHRDPRALAGAAWMGPDVC